MPTHHPSRHQRQRGSVRKKRGSTVAEAALDQNFRVGVGSKLERFTAETFIRAPMERLPFDTRVLSGVPPHTDDNVGFLLHEPLRQRLWGKLISP